MTVFNRSVRVKRVPMGMGEACCYSAHMSGSGDNGAAGMGLPGAASPRVRHLLDVARKHFVDRGFEAVSIDSLARAGGVSKETIYRHFSDKEALFRAALDMDGDEFSARALAVHAGARTPDMELAGLARAILDSAIDRGMFSALWIAVSVQHRMPDLAARLIEGHGRGLEVVREALEQFAHGRGVAGAINRELALDLGSLVVGGPALLMGFAAGDDAQRDRVSRRVSDLFAGGVTAAFASSPAPLGPLTAPPDATEVPPHIGTLLDVAAQHFLERGYEAANLDHIGAEARVGRGTLYRHVGNKAGLFAAAMQAQAWKSARAAEPTPLAPGVLDPAGLMLFAEKALENLASALSIRVHHAVITQSRRDPALARNVFTIQRAPWVTPLAEWLASMGLPDQHEWHAQQLLVLAQRGNRLLAGGQPPSAQERRRYAERAVTIFLHGFTAALSAEGTKV